MAIINAAAWGKNIYPRPFTSWVGLGYDMYADMVEPLGFEVRTDDQAIIEQTEALGLGIMQQADEGGSTIFDDMQQLNSKQYSAASYRLGFILTKDAIRDGKALRLAEIGSKEIGRAYKETRNIVAANVYNQAFSSSQKGVDNATLISSSHSSGLSTYSNILSTNATLSEAAIEQAVIDRKAIKNGRGIRMPLRFVKLIVPANLEFEASRLMDSEYRTGTGDNDVSAIVKRGVVDANYFVCDYLTDNNAWFLLTNQSAEGLTFFDRQKLELSNDTQFSSDNFMAKGHARFTAGCGEWRHIFGSQGL